MALIRHSAKGIGCVGVSPLRRQENNYTLAVLLRPQRRGEASIDGRNREGNAIIFGMLRPYRILNNFQSNKIKKARFYQCL
jgi:hypothetical protein